MGVTVYLFSPGGSDAGALGSTGNSLAGCEGAVGAGCEIGAADPDCSKLAGAVVLCVARYASAKLVTKNNVASTAVAREKNVAEPRAPNTVPEAPAPNPVPASAPLPRCSSTRATIKAAIDTCVIKTIVCNISAKFLLGGRAEYLEKFRGYE